MRNIIFQQDNVTIFEVSKDEIWPYFGLMTRIEDSITHSVRFEGFIVDGLPRCARAALWDHEFEHIDDGVAEGLVHKERDSIFASLKTHPIGTLVLVWLTLISRDRRNLYINRTRRNR